MSVGRKASVPAPCMRFRHGLEPVRRGVVIEQNAASAVHLDVDERGADKVPAQIDDVGVARDDGKRNYVDHACAFDDQGAVVKPS